MQSELTATGWADKYRLKRNETPSALKAAGQIFNKKVYSCDFSLCIFPTKEIAVKHSKERIHDNTKKQS